MKNAKLEILAKALGSILLVGIQECRATPAKVAKVAKVAPSQLAEALAALAARCPDYVEPERWHQCLEDGGRFLADWGDQPQALGWTAGDLFGLHEPPANPHPRARTH